MGIDDAGHRHGGASTAYRAAARRADALLALHLPAGLEADYRVVVTSDHGMGDHGMGDDEMHGGSAAEEIDVPFWLFGAHRSTEGVRLRQTEIAGIVCALLGVSHAEMDINEALV